MGFSQDTGYVPATMEEIMTSIMENINVQFGTTYIWENFIGSNFYKYFYTLAQELQKNDIKTSEIFLRMQEYFEITNEKILRPNTTHPGILDYLASKGYPSASTKAPIDSDAGKAYVCVNVDELAVDYSTKKLEICTIIKDCIVAGVVSQGTEVETITLDNGQSFDFKFNLPDEIPVKLRLTITLSENNLFAISAPEVSAALLFANTSSRYQLGKNFEPQRYFSVVDAPWASKVLLEWSNDAGATWSSTIYDAAYDDLFTFELADITIVED